MNRTVPSDNLVRQLGEDELWNLMDLCADFYWQENTLNVCTFLRVRSGDPESGILRNLRNNTLWDAGMTVTGDSQSWPQHLEQRANFDSFADLICSAPESLANDEKIHYISISGKPQFDGLGKFIGYHCIARDITHQVSNEQTLRRFRAAMDMSGDMIYLVDRATLRFVDVNETACRNTGLSREILLSSGPAATLNETEEEIARRYDRLIAEGTSSRLENTSVNRHGDPVTLETHSRATCIDGRWIIIGATRNVTSRKRSEENARKLQQMFSALSETNAAILRAETPQALFQSVCEAAIKGGQFNVAIILTPDSNQNLRAVAHAGTSDETASAIIVTTGEDVNDTRGIAGIAYRTGKACISNDYLNDDRAQPWHDAAKRNGVKGAAAFPLLTRKNPVGAMLFYSAEKDSFDEETINLLQHMADNASFALDNFESEKLRLEAALVLRESEERFRSMTHLSSDFYWEQNAQLRFTKYEGKIVGESNAEAVETLLGSHIWALENVTPSSMTWDQFKNILNKQERFRDFEISFINSANTIYHLSLSGEPFFNEKNEFMGYRGISRDVTERKRISDHIKYLATHDHLTGLPNRVMFTELLETATKLAARYNRGFAIFFIDLDRFKLINDTYGHHMGDALLKEVARRLRLPLRSSDVVARMGGDEFVVLVQEVTDRKNISKVASNILATFTDPIVLGEKECRITVSIGISIYGVDALDEETLIKHSDAAMYVAKDEGKDNFQFYSRRVHLQTQERIDLEINLRNALKQNEMTLYYQPKLNLTSGMIAGVEALLRWTNKQLGSIPPDKFIPVAEANGLIIPIGEWVITTACMQSMQWQRQGLFPFCVAVNLSARQFNDPELMQKIRNALEVSGMSPYQLEIEITESTVINHPQRAMKLLDEMKSMGLKIALDDFGTGYSSLGQLKHYPIDTLKIDRSFITEIPIDEDDMAITKAIITMAKTLGLTVVAEGVETLEQLEFLRAEKCHHIQGFYFQKPIPADEFQAWCEQHDPQKFLQSLKK